MNPRDLTRLRAVLISRRDELQVTLSRVQEQLRNATAVHADAADQAVASYDKNAMQLMAEMTSRQLRSLNEALQRLEGGDYGQCANCGQEIGITRLQAIPWARLCVGCQELREGFGGR